jgi:hypothetical protein
VFLEDILWSGDLQIVMELHRRLLLLHRLWDGCGLLDPFDDFPSTSNHARPTQGGSAAATHRQHGLEVEDEWHLKGRGCFQNKYGYKCTKGGDVARMWITCFLNLKRK